MHLKDLQGTVFPESPRPQIRVIPTHTRLSFPFFLKTVIRRDTLLLRNHSIPNISQQGWSKFLPIRIVFLPERWLQVNHVHFLHYGTG
jgi:hypothetical protein